jgi:uncharacterized protein (TIGR02302 family)
MIFAARGIVAWERLWPAALGGLMAAGLYAVLALTGILESLSSPVRIVLLGLTGTVIFVLYWRSFSSFRLPGWADGARRLERDSGLLDRPLTEGNDQLAAGHADPFTARLWQLHMLRLLAGAKTLKLGLPSPKVGRNDPYYLRFAVLAALVAAFVYAGPQAGNRLHTALMPPLADPTEDVLFNAWVSPPPYTALPPQTLAEGTTPGSGDVTVATGSKLSLRLRDRGAVPRLVILPSAEPVEFVETEGGFEAEIILTEDVHVTAEIGVRPLGDWQFSIVPDMPPAIAFVEAPVADERKAVVFNYKLADDYGVADASARIVPVANPDATPLLVPLAPPANARQGAQTIARDLTAHGYAGAEVEITLIATDAAGQTGMSEPVIFKLPERIFTHPLARAIIEQRKNLAVNGEEGRETAEVAMEALSIGPDLFYGEDYGVYLGIRAIRHRLVNIRDEAEKQPAMSLMWDMAVALEEGELADALEALRAAQEALEDAIRRGASEEEIEELMDRLRTAMARYMQQLAENAQPGGQMPQGGQMMTFDSLEALMQAIEDLARTGNAEEAAQLLAGLMAMLENMQMVQGQGGQPGQQGQEGQQAGPQQEAIQGLGDLMGQQRQLMDRTFRAQRGQQGQQGQQGQPGEGQQGNSQAGPGAPGQGQSQFGQQFGDQPGGQSPGALAQEQQNLNETLRGIMQGLQDGGQQAPEGLAGAGEAMGEAQNELQGGQFGSAAEAQQNALNQMRQGAQELARSLNNQNTGAGQTANGQVIEDPLGRRLGGNNPVGRLMEGLPAQNDLQRAREILDELRRRAAELGRSQEELDYIERLLDLF